MEVAVYLGSAGDKLQLLLRTQVGGVGHVQVLGIIIETFVVPGEERGQEPITGILYILSGISSS